MIPTRKALIALRKLTIENITESLRIKGYDTNHVVSFPRKVCTFIEEYNEYQTSCNNIVAMIERISLYSGHFTVYFGDSCATDDEMTLAMLVSFQDEIDKVPQKL